MKSRVIVAAALALSLGVVPAFAQGGGGGGGGSGGSGGQGDGAGESVKKCKKNQVWDKTAKKCVKVSYGILPDEELYQQGSALAQAGEFDWALTVLAAIRN